MSTKPVLPPLPTARLLLDTFRAFETELATKLANKGFDDITTANFNILRHLNPEGMQLSMLAKDAQISKQAIGKMAKNLILKGYVDLSPDAQDARAKRICLTSKGKKLIKLAIDIVTEMEEQYQTMLGKKNYKLFRQVLTEICELHKQHQEN